MYETNYIHDNLGFVKLLDHMGDDLTVVNAARVSFSKRHTEFDEVKDTRLINFLARNNHWTPFGQVTLQFHIKMPIFVVRQYYKHQIGLTRNEVSRRYVDTIPEYFTADFLRAAADDKKQGSTDEPVEMSDALIMEMRGHFYNCSALYNKLLRNGVCAEQARMVLPQSMYTEFIETGSLAAYARIAGLRMKDDAQKEIRIYAEAISHIVEKIAPVSWKALTEKNHG